MSSRAESRERLDRQAWWLSLDSARDDIGGELTDDLLDRAVRQLALRAVLSDVAEHFGVGDRVEHGVARTAVDVFAPRERRHDHDVVGFPIETLAADLAMPLAVD